MDGVAPAFPSFLLGLTGGLLNTPLRSVYLGAVPADARGNAMSVMNTAIYLLTTAVAALMIGLFQAGILPTPQHQLWFLAKAYHVHWTTAYRNEAVVRRAAEALDTLYVEYRKNPKIAQAEPSIYNDEWFGLLRSQSNRVALTAIYPKWIHNHRFHNLGWW